MLIECTLHTNNPDHCGGQSETGNKVRAVVGWQNAKWVMGQGLNLHTWRIKCTKEESIVLALISDKVSYTSQTELLNEKERLEEVVAGHLIRIAEIDEQIGEI